MNLTMQEFYALPREERGRLMLDEGKVPKVKVEQVYLIPSQFKNGVKYRVVEHHNHTTCSCPDFHYRRKPCKHIFAVGFWKDLRQYLTKEGVYQETEQAIPTCVYCNSLQVVKNGKRKAKQRFKCEACHKTFVANPEFKGISVEPKVVVMCLDLYFKGLSLRKIQSTLKEFYSVSVTHETVRAWKNRFMKQINDYLEQYKPELKENWHTDELKLKSKKKWLWVWNTISEDSKFLMATTVTNERSTGETRQHFKKAKQNNGCSVPPFITTDGMQSYRRAVKKEFHTVKKKTQHLRSVGFFKNQLVERLHGSERERLKVFRGLADKKSVERYSRDYRTYYNYVREHQSIKTTPAIKAGLDLRLGENKWLSLIKQSSQK